MLLKDISKRYDPHSVERKWYSFWIEKNYFYADVNSNKEPYCIVIPPPNITGSLHMGHALNNTLQDILIRWKRMEGYNALWLPGTDHAGIATQNVVERQLAEEGLTREDLGREKFMERVWRWKEQSGGTIINQLKRLGASCDWSRERFTMDEGLSLAVQEVFIRLYKEGLIYRDYYIINWCPRCKTALSDIEVDYEEINGHLYYIRYLLKDGKGYITIATTRPETMLGDTAVAVHPQDERYLEFKNRIVILPLVGRELPVIADEGVDPQFGTGAVKITPAHDPDDFEIGKKHGLLQVKILNEDGTISREVPKYGGIDRFKCREEILKDLKAGGYLIRTENHLHALGHCYRCKTIIEPYLSRQWFVKTKELAEPAIRAVEEGKIRFIPESWTKTYFEWMHNIKDWCISRQIWWGHRIPAWYCQSCEEIHAAREKPARCQNCGGLDFKQEEDVLDTWFSSALWPFSTLGWPEETPELRVFYPTSVLSTGFDIIFFWVARMIMMGLKFRGDVPFREVYIHALVRDAQGVKMSKSRGNIIDPLEVIDKYGTDALRFTLAILAAQGRDICLSEERIEGYRNFCNKLWNASRFVLMNLEDFKPLKIKRESLNLNLADRWIFSRFNRLVKKVTEQLTSYNFDQAAQALYDFLWHEYCDWYVELAKPRLYQGSDEIAKRTAQYALSTVLEGTLRLLHPFMPFITEEIWQQLPHKGESIMVSPWPTFKEEEIDLKVEEEMSLIMETVRAIRNIRGEMNVPPTRKASVIIRAPDPMVRRTLEDNFGYLRQLANLEELKVGKGLRKPKASATAVVGDLEIYVPLEGLIDLELERSRLFKERERIKEELKLVNKKLSDENFLLKAPGDVVLQEKKKQQKLLEAKKKLERNLRSIGKG